MTEEININVIYSSLIYFINIDQLCNSVVSVQDFEEEILSSNCHRLRRKRNIYTFDIFPNHCMDVEEIDEPGRNGLKFHYLEIGPLNLPESNHMAVWNISSLSIPGRQDTHHGKISLDFCDQEQTFQYTL